MELYILACQDCLKIFKFNCIQNKALHLLQIIIPPKIAVITVATKIDEATP